MNLHNPTLALLQRLSVAPGIAVVLATGGEDTDDIAIALAELPVSEQEQQALEAASYDFLNDPDEPHFPYEILGDFCGNCGETWICKCDDPIQMCGICGDRLCDCRCSERQYADAPIASPPRYILSRSWADKHLNSDDDLKYFKGGAVIK